MVEDLHRKKAAERRNLVHYRGGGGGKWKKGRVAAPRHPGTGWFGD